MISVVIPALNEAAGIDGQLARLRRQGFGDIIVVDGGSDDDTRRLALAAGARILRAPRGRAAQMNAGAALATGDVLIFLHADTALPDGAAETIGSALRARDVQAGCFRLRFDREHPLLRLYAWASRFDTYWTTFGDQAFFVRRAAFDAAGGFPVQPLMEDVELRRRLKRIGRFVKLTATVTTSARRFTRDGLVRRQVLNAVLLLGYAAGVDPERLKRLYV